MLLVEDSGIAIATLVQEALVRALHTNVQVILILACGHVVMSEREMADLSVLWMLCVNVVLGRFVTDTERLESTH